MRYCVKPGTESAAAIVGEQSTHVVQTLSEASGSSPSHGLGPSTPAALSAMGEKTTAVSSGTTEDGMAPSLAGSVGNATPVPTTTSDITAIVSAIEDQQESASLQVTQEVIEGGPSAIGVRQLEDGAGERVTAKYVSLLIGGATAFHDYADL